MAQASTTFEGVSIRVAESAEKLKRHIRASNLRPGDRYLTAADASRLLGESVTTVQRAMALLARQKILERRPKAGTFVGEAIDQADTLACIHVLLPEECLHEPGMDRALWQCVDGIRQVIPTVSARFDFMPRDQVGFARRIIDRTGSDLAGIVLVLASRELRAFFNASAIPTVVMGGVEADLTNLYWITLDQVAIGRLLTDYLLGRGHRKLVTIMRDVWSVGEHEVHDGISQSLADHGLAANALLIRSAPVDPAAIAEVTRAVLTEPVPPTGFICRTEFQADCVARTTAQLGVAGDIEIVACNASALTDAPRYVCAVSDAGHVEMGRMIGKMLRGFGRSDPSQPRGHRLPVKLYTPPRD